MNPVASRLPTTLPYLKTPVWAAAPLSTLPVPTKPRIQRLESPGEDYYDYKRCLSPRHLTDTRLYRSQAFL